MKVQCSQCDGSFQAEPSGARTKLPVVTCPYCHTKYTLRSLGTWTSTTGHTLQYKSSDRDMLERAFDAFITLDDDIQLRIASVRTWLQFVGNIVAELVTYNSGGVVDAVFMKTPRSGTPFSCGNTDALFACKWHRVGHPTEGELWFLSKTGVLLHQTPADQAVTPKCPLIWERAIAPAGNVEGGAACPN